MHNRGQRSVSRRSSPTTHRPAKRGRGIDPDRRSLHPNRRATCCERRRDCGRSLCCSTCSDGTWASPTICAARWSDASACGRRCTARSGRGSFVRSTRLVSRLCRISPMATSFRQYRRFPVRAPALSRPPGVLRLAAGPRRVGWRELCRPGRGLAECPVVSRCAPAEHRSDSLFAGAVASSAVTLADRGDGLLIHSSYTTTQGTTRARGEVVHGPVPVLHQKASPRR
jgi:hypothetical protein